MGRMGSARRYLCVSLTLMLAFLVGAPGFARDVPLKIKNISLNQKIFHPADDEAAVIRFAISEDALTTVNIYNRHDLLVRTLIKDKELEAGGQAVEWDGTNDLGQPLPAGAYVYTILAEKNGESALYDPADRTGGNLLKVRKPLLDEDKGEISYVMPKAGIVRIRAGIKEGAHLRTLIDWEPRAGGKNTEKWDGKDASGLIDLFKIPEREVFIFAYSLPDNAVILERSDEKVDQASAFSSAAMPVYRLKKKVDRNKKYKHALEDPIECREPKFHIIFPDRFQRTAEGVPVVSGVVPVKIKVAGKDRQRLESARFEVMFFVDTVFLFEDEEGFTPFTYRWNTRGLSEGEHILTVNIMSYDDHCGVESRKVIVKKNG